MWYTKSRRIRTAKEQVKKANFWREAPSLGVEKASADEERSAKAVARRTPPSSKQVVYLRPYFQIGMGGLVLGRASRLDAFSAYPDRP